MFTIFVGCCFNDIHYPDTADICHQHQRRRNTFWSWFTFSPAKCERDCFVWSLSREFSSNSWDLLQNTKGSSMLFFTVFFKTTFLRIYPLFSIYFQGLKLVLLYKKCIRQSIHWETQVKTHLWAVSEGAMRRILFCSSHMNRWQTRKGGEDKQVWWAGNEPILSLEIRLAQSKGSNKWNK